MSSYLPLTYMSPPLTQNTNPLPYYICSGTHPPAIQYRIQDTERTIYKVHVCSYPNMRSFKISANRSTQREPSIKYVFIPSPPIHMSPTIAPPPLP